MSPRTTYTDSVTVDESAISRAMTVVRTPIQSFLRWRERTVAALPADMPRRRGAASSVDAGAGPRRRAPERSVEPAFAHVGDTHHVHLHATPVLAVDIQIAAERPPRHDSPQPGFFLRFADRGVTRSFSLVHPPLRQNPPFAPRGGDQRDLDPFLANSVGNHRRLLVHPRHRLLLMTVHGARAISASSAVGSRAGPFGSSAPLAHHSSSPPAGRPAAPRRRAASAAGAHRVRLRWRSDTDRCGLSRSPSLRVPASAT